MGEKEGKKEEGKTSPTNFAAALTCTLATALCQLTSAHADLLLGNGMPVNLPPPPPQGIRTERTVTAPSPTITHDQDNVAIQAVVGLDLFSALGTVLSTAIGSSVGGGDHCDFCHGVELSVETLHEGDAAVLLLHTPSSLVATPASLPAGCAAWIVEVTAVARAKRPWDLDQSTYVRAVQAAYMREIIEHPLHPLLPPSL